MILNSPAPDLAADVMKPARSEWALNSPASKQGRVLPAQLSAVAAGPGGGDADRVDHRRQQTCRSGCPGLHRLLHLLGDDAHGIVERQAGLDAAHDDIDAVKRDMRQILDHLRKRNPDSRVGVVAYRDVHDSYLTRTFLFLASLVLLRTQRSRRVARRS